VKNKKQILIATLDQLDEDEVGDIAWQNKCRAAAAKMYKLPVVQKVSCAIKENMRGAARCRIFLSSAEYVDFVDAVLPYYKIRYCALITDESAWKMGYDNVLFEGAAVCRD